MTRYVVLIALMTVLAAGCSASSSDDSSAAPSGSPSTPPAAPAVAVHDGRAIEISANDTMKFSLTEVAAKPGEKLSVTVVNLGTTPKFSMGHNWVVVAAGTDIQPFLLAASEAVTADYVPSGDHKKSVVAATKLLGPNERDTVTFAAPTAPGRYEFFCTFPGHYQVGMRGVLIVA